MARKDSQAAQTVARLMQTVDDARKAADTFKLPKYLRDLLNQRLAELLDAENKQGGASGDRVKDSETVKTELPMMIELLRDGYKHIDGLKSYEVTRAEKLSAFDAYGWKSGKQGILRGADRVLALARQAGGASLSVTPEIARYPQELLVRIAAKLILLENAGAGARVGSRQSATKTRDDALAALRKITARVRSYYASASDDLDATAELNKIGMNPMVRSGQRRLPGEGEGEITP